MMKKFKAFIEFFKLFFCGEWIVIFENDKFALEMRGIEFYKSEDGDLYFNLNIGLAVNKEHFYVQEKNVYEITICWLRITIG